MDILVITKIIITIQFIYIYINDIHYMILHEQYLKSLKFDYLY